MVKMLIVVIMEQKQKKCRKIVTIEPCDHIFCSSCICQDRFKIISKKENDKEEILKHYSQDIDFKAPDYIRMGNIVDHIGHHYREYDDGNQKGRQTKW